MKNKHLFFLSLLFLPILSFTQKGNIQGKVIDAETGTTLPFASVLVKDDLIGTSTDKNGHYSLTDLEPGEYFLEVNSLGYKKQTRLAVLGESDTLNIGFGLVPLSVELQEVKITAPKHDILDEPMPMTKMEREEIHRLASTNTAELMEDIGGVSVARAGNWGSKPYFQGMTDSRVIMFIDGIKTTQSCPMGMDACAATIEPDMINSMGIQVGPGGAQYGSGNMGGVINVSTFDPQYGYLDKFKADLDIASRYKSVTDSRSGVIALKGGNKIFDFATSAGGGWHDNYKIPQQNEYTFFPEREIPYSGFNSKWLHANARLRPDKGHQVAFISQIYRGDSIGWPSRMANTHTIIPTEKRDMFAVKYEWEANNKHFKKLKTNAGYTKMVHDMVNFTTGNTQYQGLSRTNNYQTSVKSYYSFGKGHAVTMGLDGFAWQMNAKRKTVTDTTETPFVPILNHGVMYESGIYVLDRFTYNKLTLDAGLRLNYVVSDAQPAEGGILSNNLKDEQLVWTGNFSPLYRINQHLSISAALVKGFNAATPVDRFISAPMLDGFYHFGNPNLNPETNISKRIGLRGMYNKWSWNIEYFHNTLNNLIERRIDSTIASPIPGLRGVRQSQNIVKGTITGTSAYVSYYALPSLQISLNATYLKGFDNEKNPLPNIAPFEINPKITYENNKKDYWLTIKADIATKQTRYAPQYAEIYTPGYVVFDLSGGWQITDWMELSAGINNMANQYYRKHLNQVQLPEPGLNIFASVKLSLPVIGSKTAKPSLKDAKLVTLKIEGMACQFCARTVKDRSEALPKVIQSVVHLQDGKAEVIVDKSITIDELLKAIERAGYKVQIISIEPYLIN